MSIKRETEGQDVNPANRPSEQLVIEALHLSRDLNQTVYLYQSSRGWGIARKLTEIPPGALINEVREPVEHPEQNNTGGC